MKKKKYVLSLKGKILVILYSIVVLMCLSLIVLNTTTLLKLENIDIVNFYTTFIASLVFVVAYFFQVSRVILKKIYKENNLLKEDVLSWGVTIALCFLILRIILKDNKNIYVIYTAVMAITLILFTVKEISKFTFTEKRNNNYFALKILFYILIFTFAIVYVVLFFNAIFKEEIAGQIITAGASVVGGLITLGGVAWTIRSNNKDRKADLQRIENERKDEERKKAKPLFTFNMLESKPRVKEGWKFCVAITNSDYTCSLYAEIENSNKCVFEIGRIYHDKIWYKIKGNTVVLPNSKVIINFTFSEKELYFEVFDSMGNKYFYEIEPMLLTDIKDKYFSTIVGIKEISEQELYAKGTLVEKEEIIG